jgi:hypothetical protein
MNLALLDLFERSKVGCFGAVLQEERKDQASFERFLGEL